MRGRERKQCFKCHSQQPLKAFKHFSIDSPFQCIHSTRISSRPVHVHKVVSSHPPLFYPPTCSLFPTSSLTCECIFPLVFLWHTHTVCWFISSSLSRHASGISNKPSWIDKVQAHFSNQNVKQLITILMNLMYGLNSMSNLRMKIDKWNQFTTQKISAVNPVNDLASISSCFTCV